MTFRPLCLASVLIAAAQGVHIQAHSTGMTSEAHDGAEISGKLGICCWTCNETHYKKLEPIANWTYNYRLKPDTETGYPLEWAVEHKMEFVPMITKTDVDLMDGTKCDMTITIDEGENACTVEKLHNVIKSLEGTVLPPTHLMGWNEPFFVGTHHYLVPADAARMWAKFMQPLSIATGLHLVSPTTSKGKAPWMAEFLNACYANKDDETYPCDVH